jgi:hypothetical protein
VINRAVFVGCVFVVLAIGVEVCYLVSLRSKKSPHRTKKSTKTAAIGLLIFGSTIGIIGVSQTTPAAAAAAKWELKSCKITVINQKTGADEVKDCAMKDSVCAYNDKDDYVTEYCNLTYYNSDLQTSRGLYVAPQGHYKSTQGSNYFANKDSKENKLQSPTRLEVIYELYKIVAQEFGFSLDSYKAESADAIKYADPITYTAANQALVKNQKQNPKQKWETSLDKNEDPQNVKAAANWALVNQIYSGCKYYEEYRSAGQIWNIIRQEGTNGENYKKYINKDYKSNDYIRFCWNTKATRAWTMGVIKNFLINYVNRKKPLSAAATTGENAICGYGARIENGLIQKDTAKKLVPANSDPAVQNTIGSPVVMVLTANILFEKTLNAKNTNASVNTRFSAACVYEPWEGTNNQIILDSSKKEPGTYLLKTELKSAIRTKLAQVTRELAAMRDRVNIESSSTVTPTPPGNNVPPNLNDEDNDLKSSLEDTPDVDNEDNILKTNLENNQGQI